MKKIICIAFLLFNCSNAISDNKKTHGLGIPLTSNEMNAQRNGFRIYRKE